MCFIRPLLAEHWNKRWSVTSSHSHVTVNLTAAACIHHQCYMTIGVLAPRFIPPFQFSSAFHLSHPPSGWSCSHVDPVESYHSLDIGQDGRARVHFNHYLPTFSSQFCLHFMKLLFLISPPSASC